MFGIKKKNKETKINKIKIKTQMLRERNKIEKELEIEKQKQSSIKKERWERRLKPLRSGVNTIKLSKKKLKSLKRTQPKEKTWMEKMYP